MIGSDPRLHPIGQNWALWIMARGAGAGDNTWAHDFRFRDEGRAKQHRLRAFAVPTYGLFHGDEAVIAAQNPASLPPGLKQRDPLAIGVVLPVTLMPQPFSFGAPANPMRTAIGIRPTSKSARVRSLFSSRQGSRSRGQMRCRLIWVSKRLGFGALRNLRNSDHIWFQGYAEASGVLNRPACA